MIFDACFYCRLQNEIFHLQSHKRLNIKTEFKMSADVLVDCFWPIGGTRLINPTNIGPILFFPTPEGNTCLCVHQLPNSAPAHLCGFVTTSDSFRDAQSHLIHG